MSYQISTGEKGLTMFFIPWQVEALEYLEKIHPNSANSKTVWEELNKKTPISRASVINFLNETVEKQLTDYTEESGKGGYRRLYTIKYKKSQLIEELVKHVVGRLLDEFPQETANVISAL